MSLRQATGALQDISNTMNISAASSPPVYTLPHPLSLPHNVMPLAAPMSQEPPLQVAATTVATTLTHTLLSQISGGGGGGGGSSGGGGGGRGGGGPPGQQPPATQQPMANGNRGLVGKEPITFHGS